MITPIFGVRKLPAGLAVKEDDPASSDGELREKRRHPRVPIPVRCWLMEGEHTVYLRLHDLSLGGVSVRAPVPFDTGAHLSVELELPSGRRVVARADVVWLRKTEDSGPRMGASFTEFLSGQDDLQRLLDARIERLDR